MPCVPLLLSCCLSCPSCLALSSSFVLCLASAPLLLCLVLCFILVGLLLRRIVKCERVLTSRTDARVYLHVRGLDGLVIFSCLMALIFASNYSCSSISNSAATLIFLWTAPISFRLGSPHFEAYLRQRGIEPPPVLCPRRQERRPTNYSTGTPKAHLRGC